MPPKRSAKATASQQQRKDQDKNDESETMISAGSDSAVNLDSGSSSAPKKPVESTAPRQRGNSSSKGKSSQKPVQGNLTESSWVTESNLREPINTAEVISDFTVQLWFTINTLR